MPSRSVRVFQVDVFTDRLFAGNPAGVVLGAEQLDEEEMQAIARELNNSDSAFVLPASAPDHDVHLRFFTPAREVGFVGHATVAAHVARLAAGACRPGTLRQRSRSGIFDVELSGSADSPQVAVSFPAPAEPVPVEDAMRAKLLDILGLDTAALDLRCPPRERPAKPHRDVPLPAGARSGPAPVYPPNVVRNQKYSVFNFVPLVLLEQFSYFFNLYFLVVALSQLIPVLRIGTLARAQPRPLPPAASR